MHRKLTPLFTLGNPRQTFSFVKDEQGQVSHLVVTIEKREVGRARKIK
jgi:hypothetical protein